MSKKQSQSLHFLRAFQRKDQRDLGNMGVAKSRNPFIFLGHFNQEIKGVDRTL